MEGVPGTTRHVIVSLRAFRCHHKNLESNSFQSAALKFPSSSILFLRRRVQPFSTKYFRVSSPLTTPGKHGTSFGPKFPNDTDIKKTELGSTISNSHMTTGTELFDHSCDFFGEIATSSSQLLITFPPTHLPSLLSPSSPLPGPVRVLLRPLRGDLREAAPTFLVTPADATSIIAGTPCGY